MKEDFFVDWNPWHGCTKISTGCRYCYVYRQDEMYGAAVASSVCRKTQNFGLPVKKKRDGSYKIKSGSYVYTCFTSDFLLDSADDWRGDCWKMIRERSDCFFCFFTKRIDRLADCLPHDWGEGYDNLAIGCTVENQDRADYRLPIFNSLPIKHKMIIAAPLLGPINLSRHLNGGIQSVSVSGESGIDARICDYKWVLDIRRQCVEKNIPFSYHQTGAHLIKDGKRYNIKRSLQISQAKRAGIDFMTEYGFVPKNEDCDKGE